MQELQILLEKQESASVIFLQCMLSYMNIPIWHWISEVLDDEKVPILT